MGKNLPDWLGDEEFESIKDEESKFENLNEDEKKEFREIEGESPKERYKTHRIILELRPIALDDGDEFYITSLKYAVSKNIKQIKIKRIELDLIAKIYPLDNIRHFEIYENNLNPPGFNESLILNPKISSIPSTIIIEDGRVYHDLKLRSSKEYFYKGQRLNILLKTIVEAGGLEKFFEKHWSG